MSLRSSTPTALRGVFCTKTPRTPEPQIIVTDTASYSDQVFGLFRLLGYQFAPRLADKPEQRFWRIDPTAEYGAFDGLARHRINTRLITEHSDDLLRVAGSLHRGTVKASQILRVLQGQGRPTRSGAPWPSTGVSQRFCTSSRCPATTPTGAT